MHRKPGVMPEITREMYKNIKKYDRRQLDEFCKDLYCYGVEDGRNSVPGVDAENIIEAISKIKGLGPKRMEEIKHAVDSLFK